MTPLQEKIVSFIAEKKDVKVDEVAELMGKSTRTVKRHIDELKRLGILDRVGSKKNGHWQLSTHDIRK